MLKNEIQSVLDRSQAWGWVLEPEAKHLLSLGGMSVPRFVWAKDLADAEAFADEIGYPVVAKVISPAILHKSEHRGVIPGIEDAAALKRAYEHFQGLEGFAGILVEELLSGFELIAGLKVDRQFGPVVLLGIGGTAVEIYKDTALRMAPLQPKDVSAMVAALTGHPLLEGYRGRDPIDFQSLTDFLVTFSNWVMPLEEHITSIDINPLICSSQGCVAADARILLPNYQGE